MENINAPKQKAGRPSTPVIWPDNQFTVEELNKSSGISKVTLYHKIKEALDAKVISAVSLNKLGKGRPQVVYKKV